MRVPASAVPYVPRTVAPQEKTGHAGLNNLLAAYDDKSAYAQCIFSYSAGPGHAPVVFDGRTAGRIVPARGPVRRPYA